MLHKHLLRSILASKLHPIRPPNAFPTPTRTHSSTTNPPPDDLEALLAQPSWSVKSLFTPTTNSTATSPPEITQKQLHHLLRLSALPLPTSPAEEQRMICDLQSQLGFVRAIQEVDTEGVEPLVAVRDESVEGEREGMIGLEEMRGELGREEVVGIRGRIVRRKGGGGGKGKGEGDGKEEVGGLDLLAQAPRRLGRYVVVDTAKD